MKKTLPSHKSLLQKLNGGLLYLLGFSVDAQYEDFRMLCGQSEIHIHIDNGGVRCVIVKTLDCGIVLSRSIMFTFRLWKIYKPPYPPSYGLNSTTTILLNSGSRWGLLNDPTSN